MAAGYNGIESGIPIISSAAMIAVLVITGHDTGSAVIYAGIIGAAPALYIFNRYPAQLFVGGKRPSAVVGDTGTRVSGHGPRP